MNYYLDTEFLEGKQLKRFLGIQYGETKPTIDLISIGIISENGREYYSISKDFNLWEAWNRYDLVKQSGDMRNHFPEGKKVYWIRENVLKPIYDELVLKYALMEDKAIQLRTTSGYNPPYKFNYKTFKKLIKLFGKSNKEIAEGISNFIFPDYKTIKINKAPSDIKISLIENGNWIEEDYIKPKFYAYFADYDWVVFCQLFGKMIDLPKGFPMYCNDLKQDLDRKVQSELAIRKKNKIHRFEIYKSVKENSEEILIALKSHKRYPKQTNEHNALADVKWNLELHKFLKSL